MRYPLRVKKQREMPLIKYTIKLSEEEKSELKKIENNPKTKARAQKRARILVEVL